MPKVNRMEQNTALLLSKAFSFFDGIGQLFNKLLVALVRRKIKSVETSVTSWQPRIFANLLDAEVLRTIAPYKNQTVESIYLSYSHHVNNPVKVNIFTIQSIHTIATESKYFNI